MSEVYRKRGSIVRYENGVVVRVCESGEAIEEGALFRCAPAPSLGRLPERDPGPILRAVRSFQAVVQPHCAIERLIAVEGWSEHEFGGRRWTEWNWRVHVSMVRGTRRVLLDHGAAGSAEQAAPAERWIRDIDEVARAFARSEGERDAPPRLRLTPGVVAAIVPIVQGVMPPNLHLEQVAGRIDGKGLPVEVAAGPPWPNWYRPSYRLRPQRVPIDVAVRCSVTEVEPGLPRAIALLEPPDGTTVRALCLDGARAYTSTIRIVRVDAVAEPAEWYPTGGGVWAGEAEVVT